MHEWLELRPQDCISPRSLQATLQLVANASDVGLFRNTNASEALGKESGVITLATERGEFDAAYLGRSRLTEKPAAGRFAYLEVEVADGVGRGR